MYFSHESDLKVANPYSSLPDHHFWRRAVSRVEPFFVDPVVEPAFLIDKSERIATVGSCFAQHISRSLLDSGFNFFVTEEPGAEIGADEGRRRNYGVFSARYGTIYTVRQLLQLLQEAFAGRQAHDVAWPRKDGMWVDPFRPQIEPDGFPTVESLRASREIHINCVRQMIESMDVLIFTLGLTEAWRSRQDGSVYPLAPGVIAGSFDASIHEFINFSVDEVRADMGNVVKLIRDINPVCRILITVSPVPLIATFEKRHVLVSTAASKAILRVVAEEAVRRFPRLGYFPSYEIITGPHARGQYYGDDLREVEPAGVKHAMRIFKAHYLKNETSLPNVFRASISSDNAKSSGPYDIICDEEVLDLARGETVLSDGSLPWTQRVLFDESRKALNPDAGSSLTNSEFVRSSQLSLLSPRDTLMKRDPFYRVADAPSPSADDEAQVLRARIAEQRERTRSNFSAAQMAAKGGQTPKVIAFYLPQFHAIAENDKVWGDGFTEWTNVRRAKPNFSGHFQPRIPADLGYYNLRDPDVMDRQAALAKRYGIHGFCYYYYYFSGRRVLEMPLERLLETGRPSIPFCVAWANENWTMTWDGRDDVVILDHQYSEDQDRAVITDLMRYFRHPLYIRIDGRPLLLIYRARVIPDVIQTTSLWRQACRDAGIGEIYLAMVEAADLAWAEKDPVRYGFDAAVEFPPHNAGASVPPPEPLYNPNFNGLVFDYDMVVEKYATAPIPPYRRFRGVTLGWDNTARRQDNPAVFINATPAAYQAWLEAALEDVQVANQGPERLVFINAWNEWGEGTYLEPDIQHGHSFLEATRAGLENHASRYQVAVGAISLPSDSGQFVEQTKECFEHDVFTVPFKHSGIDYLDFIRKIDEFRKPRSYFEIGTNSGASAGQMSCDTVCVDPNFQLTADVVGKKRQIHLYQLTSDDFFAQFDLRRQFPSGVDIAFLDGLHLCEFLLRDFINTERFCHSKSVVFLHDCLPLNARMAERIYRSGDPAEGPLWGAWTGDVWRVLFALKKYRPALSVEYLDCPPTGLVAIYNVDPKSDVLKNFYQEALQYMMSLELDEARMRELWKLYPMRSSNSLIDQSEGLQTAFGL